MECKGTITVHTNKNWRGFYQKKKTGEVKKPLTAFILAFMDFFLSDQDFGLSIFFVGSAHYAIPEKLLYLGRLLSYQ